MSERRSSRSRNTVKYSGFDNESEDDFTDVSSHPSKKSKSSDTEGTNKKSTKSAKDKNWLLDVDIVDSTLIKSHKLNKTSRRTPLSQKIYERELQEALELSVLETGGNLNIVDHGKECDKPKPELLTLTTDLGDSHNQKVLSESVNSCQGSPQNPAVKASAHYTAYSHGTVVLDDSIELLEEKADGRSTTNQMCQQRASRRQVNKLPVVMDSVGENSEDESDFKSGADSDGDESNSSSSSAEMSEDDGSSDFKPGSKKTKQTVHKPNKTAAHAKKLKTALNNHAKKSPQRQMVKPRLTEASDGNNTSKPSSSVPTSSNPRVKSAVASSLIASHPCANMPSSLVSQWKPPPLASQNKTSLTIVKSPSSGLRIGLSRNQRVTSLHPSAKVI